jgi:hypothetical protein
MHPQSMRDGSLSAGTGSPNGSSINIMHSKINNTDTYVGSQTVRTKEITVDDYAVGCR